MKQMIVPAAIVAIMFSAAACSHGKDKDAGSETALLPVEVTPVVTDSVTLFKEYPGSLIADRNVQVVARVNGTLSRPLYNAGDYVREGQPLFRIETDNYRNAGTTAQANLATARSENEYAESHYEAVARAYERNAVSKMELSQALNARDQSRAAIRTAEAALSDANNDLAKTSVTAPLSGHISVNELSGGSYVRGEDSPVLLATIYDDATVIANFAIEDASFMRMFENPNNRHLIDYSAIHVKFAEELPHKYTADLNYMAPSVDASTGTILLQAEIKNKYNELRAGMYCTIDMPYKVEPRALLVRDASIGTDQLGKYVYVINDSGKVVYTPVKTGDLVDDTMRVVTSGLSEGQRYVTSALLKVRDGMTVRPVERK